jgi:signal transduction histidine kinase
MNDDVCYGFVGFDYVYNYSDISEKEYEVLAMYSKILNSLEIRKRYEKELIETNNALETKVKLTTEDLLLKEKKHSLALQQHIVDLEEILFALSHKFRQPVTNILGLSNLLDFPLDSDDKVKEINGYLKKSAKLLDSYTHELTQLAHERKNKKIL